jgi:GntR family transcriptional repressor for pyruvate dehydrogenase complex
MSNEPTLREVPRVQRELAERIVGGAFPPGVRLPAETALAKEFGCGRSTIREALGQLAAAGLIESRRGSGAHVLDWRRHGTPALLPTYLPHAMIGGDAKPMLVELLWMRRLLAKEAVRLAAKYAKPAPLKEVRKLFERSGQEIDPQAHVTLELEVFRSLLQASELWPVVWFANSFWSPMLELHATFALALGGPPADYAQAMDRLLTLIEAHDEVGALTEVDRYLDRVDASLAAALAGEAAPADKADSTAKPSSAETAGSAAKPSTAAKAPAPAKRAKSRAATV